MKKFVTMCVVVSLMLASSTAEAAFTVQDFEGIPDLYVHSQGEQNLGSYLPGLAFGPNVTILDKVRSSYNHTAYPPHSGDAVIFSRDNSTIRVDFDIPSTYVEAWYTSVNDFYMEAYDAGDNLLDSDVSSGNSGSNSLLSVSGGNIAYVLLHDSGNYYTIDDLGYSLITSIPAPGAILLSGIGVGLVGWLRRRRTL